MAATAGFTARALGVSQTGTCFTRSMDLHFLQSLAKTCHPLRLLRPRLPRHLQAAQLTVLALAPSSPLSSSLSSEDGSASAVSLLDKLRVRKLKDVPNTSTSHTSTKKKTGPSSTGSSPPDAMASAFEDLPLTDELLSAINELGLTEPTEVQCRAIPAVLEGQSVVIASHTGSGKTLAYMIPIVQRLKEDELQQDKGPRPRRPRAVVLCPTRELAEQVFRVSKSICHHAKFRVTLIGGGVRMRPQEDALNGPIDMLVGTPGRVLKHIEDGNVAFGDIKYVILDEADTMFDRGFGPDVKKFLGPLRSRSKKSENAGFQTVLVTATITKAVQKLLDDEFPGVKHIQTSTLHKKISTARHGFIKLAATENKLESLLQVLEPSLAKKERVMVFCNTLNSCRAVDHYLNENGISTVNYHGAVPAEERVEVLNKFRTEDQNCPALVCTDLAARGLDLVVDHVIMFDFPLNSIDYLHRTGRTARMGARGKVTSLVSKKSLVLAELIEEAIHKGETLENIRKDVPEVRKQPVKAKTTEKGKPKPQGSSLRGNPSKKYPGARPTSEIAKPFARGTKLVVSKAKRAPVVRVGVVQKGSKRTGQKVAGKR